MWVIYKMHRRQYAAGALTNGLKPAGHTPRIPYRSEGCRKRENQRASPLPY